MTRDSLMDALLDLPEDAPIGTDPYWRERYENSGVTNDTPPEEWARIREMFEKRTF